MADRRRVGLYLRSKPSDGGMFQYTKTLLGGMCRLPADDFEVVVAYTEPEIEPYVRSRGVEAHHIPWPRAVENGIGLVSSGLVAAGVPVAALRAAGRLDPLARRLHGLSCVVWVFPAGDPVVYRSRLRSVAVIHDLMHRYQARFPEVGRWPIRTRRDWHYRALCASAARLVVDSELGARQVAESYGVDAGRIAVLPYSAPEYVEAPGPVLSPEPRLPEHYLYYPAQFWPHKNHLNLARAVRILAERGLDPRVVLSGGTERGHRAFADLVTRLGIAERFVELGYVPDDLVATLYRRSLGLVYPSYFGPTNLPPLEALLCETPMAVSGNFSGMREQLGDAALYFDPDDPASIADAMADLLQNPARRSALVEAGRRIAHRYRSAAFDANVRRMVEDALG